MICFKCTGQEIAIERSDVIAENFINANVVKFSFCERWSGMVKTAQFTQRRGDEFVTYNVLIDELTGTAAMPNDVIAGDLMISAFGYDPDTGVRITSTISVVKVMPSGFVGDGETPIPPTPDLYAQLVARVNNSANITAQSIAEALGYTPANDSDVTRFIGYDWARIGNASNPYGWRKGYWSTSTGEYKDSRQYIGTTELIAFPVGARVRIIPASGYYITWAEYAEKDAGTFTGNGSALAVDEVLEFTAAGNRYYGFSSGKFTKSDAAERVQDGAFISGYVLEYTCAAVAVEEAERMRADEEMQRAVDGKVPALNAAVSMYDTIGVCGASWDSGYIYVASGTTVENSDLSWGRNLARRNGNECKSFAWHSMNTRTWQTDEHCLPALLANPPCDLYIVTLGGNDSELGGDYLGSISDIASGAAYANYPDTFFGNYGKIVEQIKAHAPHAKIILAMWYDAERHTETRGAYSAAIDEIATHYGLPRINWAADAWYGGTFLQDNLVGNHPTAVQLSGIACAFERLYSKCVNDFYDYFADYGANK